MPKRQPKARERPHRIPNPQIWDAAEQYYQACVILEEQQLDDRTLLPLLHSGAIALELYLKCLGAKDRYQKVEDTLIQDLERVHAEACPTHRLSKLLKEISVDTRNRLIAAFESSPTGDRRALSRSFLADMSTYLRPPATLSRKYTKSSATRRRRYWV
jgi:hypothetical protein